MSPGGIFMEPRLGFASGDEIGMVQDRLLREHVAYLGRFSPYYRELFAARGIDPARVQGVADLPRLPLTGKDELAAHAARMVCDEAGELVDLALTSGTTGPAVSLPQSRRDLERLAYNEECSLRLAGIVAGDRVLLAVALDRCFMAGLAYFLGLVRIGALAIRGGAGELPALTELVFRQRPTAIIGIPTLLLRLADQLEKQGVDLPRLGVRRLVCIGEPVRGVDLRLSPLGANLSRRWGCEVFGTYASTEMATGFTDCECGRGGHIPPDLTIVEIVDPQGVPLPPGEIGEVVATPLQVTGLPLLRFRTGDYATLHAEPCGCGRQTPRLGPVVGRKAEMLKVKGVTLFPQAVHTALQEIDKVVGCYLVVGSEFDQSDRLTVAVALPGGIGDSAAIADLIAARTRVRPTVRIVTPEEWTARTRAAGRRKPQLFFDERPLREGGD